MAGPLRQRGLDLQTDDVVAVGGDRRRGVTSAASDLEYREARPEVERGEHLRHHRRRGDGRERSDFEGDILIRHLATFSRDKELAGNTGYRLDRVGADSRVPSQALEKELAGVLRSRAVATEKVPCPTHD